jgi:phage baseplate assembly protein W
MTNLLGTTVSFPVRPDIRGTVAVVSTDDEIITQAIFDLIETRQGERVMLNNYGLPDLIFNPLDAGFSARLAFFVEEQIRNYISAIEKVSAEAVSLSDGGFVPDDLPAANHTAAIRVRWTKRGQSVPQELIYPTWRLIE